jgi:sulfane dehydrogenase subunit SoxC
MSNTPNIRLDASAKQIIDEMIAVEARHIAQRQLPEVACACKDGMFPTRAPTNRRTFLFAAGSTAGAAAAAVLATPSGAADSKAPPGAEYFEVPADPTKQLGRPVAGDGGYGSRSQFETEVRWRFPTANEYTSWSMTPLDKMLGNLTASGLHFERHHGGIPTIDSSKHLLFVHGMVDQAKKFTVADLKRLPSVTRKHFIECSGNGLTEWNKADAEDRAGHTWPAEHVGMDRRSICDARSRSRPEGQWRLGRQVRGATKPLYR